MREKFLRSGKTLALPKPQSFREALAEFLTPEELSKATTSFDIIGDIAILEVADSLKKHEKKIGKALLQVHNNLKTVCKRAGIHEGEFRVRHVKVIAGKKKTLAEYKESGARMLVDVDKVYFTPRLSHERERIAAQVKDGEKIGYFFAGVGPFGFVILKKNPNVTIDAVELNPDAVKLMGQNIKLNKLECKMKAILGDVKKFKTKKYDRILMPLPKSSEDFLQDAFRCSKKKTIIHFYFIGDKDRPFAIGEGIIKEKAKLSKIKYKIKNKRVVRPFSPSQVQVVFDIQITS